MDAKLKLLKVIELKDILTKASLNAPARANKQDLIARILASPKAVQVYESIHTTTKPTPNDDLLAPPDDVDWNTDELPTEVITSHTQPTSVSVPKTSPIIKAPVAKAQVSPTKPAPPPKAQETTQIPATKNKASESATTIASKVGAENTAADDKEAAADDEELEKRKKRAARFGIPVVASSATPTSKGRKPAPAVSVDADELEKRDARVRRFGLPTPSPTRVAAAPTANKRKSPYGDAGPEEMERRRKRAERFGLEVK